MAWRTTESEVRAIISTDPAISIEPFIKTANALADRVSTNDTNGVLTTAILVEIEAYLAAHFYAQRDQLYQSKKTGDASAVFQGEYKMGLQSTDPGQNALLLDETGFLAGLGKGKVSLTWLGLAPSDQTDYVDRD